METLIHGIHFIVTELCTNISKEMFVLGFFLLMTRKCEQNGIEQ